MSRPLSQQVTFKKMSAKALTQQLDGVEQPYPVYYVGNRVKVERPTQPGQTYRWINS
jgi:hypothetical protein